MKDGIDLIPRTDTGLTPGKNGALDIVDENMSVFGIGNIYT